MNRFGNHRSHILPRRAIPYSMKPGRLHCPMPHRFRRVLLQGRGSFTQRQARVFNRFVLHRPVAATCREVSTSQVYWSNRLKIERYTRNVFLKNETMNRPVPMDSCVPSYGCFLPALPFDFWIPTSHLPTVVWSNQRSKLRSVPSRPWVRNGRNATPSETIREEK